MISSELTRRHVLGLCVGAAAVMAWPGLARAQSLDEARNLGYLGERPDGYLAMHDPAAPVWAVALMDRVNAERKLKYKELAVKNGTSLEAVEVVAGEKIIQSLKPGSYVMDATGTWVQK